MEATHVRCFECGEMTRLEPDDDPDDTPCAECVDSHSSDPYCVVPVAMFECPNGITSADWEFMVGFKEGRRCDDEAHEPATGDHVIEIESG